ncbi:hypothetical protein KC887_07385 [Candidatus Kaiserbacteria bacterium]|nr:hypothetical protein [Candidatus Kaiserbacteria bacterium]
MRHSDPDQFIQGERRQRQWLSHSVALLVVSPRVDQIVMALPKKVLERGVTHTRTPPQIRLQQYVTARTAALELCRATFTEGISVASQRLLYLGSGRGNAHAGESVRLYGKHIHWFGIRLHQTKVLRKDSSRFAELHWCSTNHFLAMDTFAMSDRKYLLTLQALAAFAALGLEGKLVLEARRRLAA